MNDAAIMLDTVPRFGIGQNVSRNEDPMLVRGAATYSDDLSLDGQVYGLMVRSDIAHGNIRAIDTSAARAAAGVLAVYTGEDIRDAGYQPIRCGLPLKSFDGSAMVNPDRRALALGKVTHVGEPLVFVIAGTLQAAKDAAELLEIDIEPLQAVSDVRAAMADGAVTIHDGAPGNLALDWRGGDRESVERAMASAAHVTRLRLVSNRVAVAPMEPRSAIASIEDGRFTLRLGTQGVFGMKQQLANLLNTEPEKVRIVTHQVGGSFGMKIPVYPEYLCAMLGASELGRPVKWTDERAGSFLSDHQGRDTVFDARLALDGEGNFLAVEVEVFGNMGAYLGNFGPGVPTMSILKNTVGLYRTPAFAMRTLCAFTNTTPTSAYRGAGRPEGVYIMERLIDRAARELGRDRIALRRQNMIGPEAMPFRAASGQTYDSGDFEKVLELALAKADHGGFAARRQASGASGLLRGFGVASYLEVTAPPGKEMGGIRFGEDGRVTIVTGTLDYGQGHGSTFAQILSERLQLPFERIDLLQGDSDELLHGGGSGGSRSVMATGTALLAAADEVVENGRNAAAHVFEAAVEDIRFADGMFEVAGTDRRIALLDLAASVREAGLDPLDAELVADTPPSTYPNGCHIAEVEIDPETGVVRLDRYSVVDDFGTVVNPMLTRGQVQGGVVQGIGQALLEHMVFDANAQPIASFMDYAMPRAGDVSNVEIDFHIVPATTNELGVKGCGEAGVTGALPAFMNAVVDALQPLGIDHIDMPVTPERVWQAIQDTTGNAAA